MMGAMSRPVPWRLVAVIAVLAVAAACAPDVGPSSPDTTPEALAFEAPLLEGGTFRGEDLAGTDVAFWFWAPW